MRVYSAVIERCPQTGLFVGFVPGFIGAHSQGETLDTRHAPRAGGEGFGDEPRAYER